MGHWKPQVCEFCGTVLLLNVTYVQESRGQLWWPRIFIPGEAVESEQTECIGRYLWSQGNQKKDIPGVALSLKKCVGIGNRHRNSDIENDASGSIKTDAVVGTSSNTESYNVQWKLA